MSLLEKLGQKRTQKDQLQQEKVLNEKKQSLVQINEQVIATEAKKQRIIELSKSLQTNYQGGEKKLADFKNKKEELKKAYEEHKDILEEDEDIISFKNKKEELKKTYEGNKDVLEDDEDIISFEDMLEAYKGEKEVRAYREAGGRGPAKEDGEAGKTGELYKAVGTLKEIKESLQSEMPEIKLNFSAVIRKGEEISNRENSFLQIEEYLKTLDTKITELKKQREEVLADTPEGKRNALLKIDNIDYKVGSADFSHLENFSFEDRVLSLSEKIGTETVKEVYTETLEKKLTEIAWDKKRPRGNGGWDDETGNEQKAIEAYPAMKELASFKYNHKDLNEFEEVYNKALLHLEKIFQDSETTRGEIASYGLRGNSDERERQKERGWSSERIYADLYLKHLEELIHLTPHEKLLDALNYRKDTPDMNTYSPEFVHAQFEKYKKVLDYIKEKTDTETKFLSEFNKRDRNDLIYKAQNDKEIREEMGLNEKNPETYLEYPSEFVNRNGGFQNAYQIAKKEGQAWEQDKKEIATISRAAVEERFAQVWERYFNEKNKGLFESVDYNKKLTQQIENSLIYLQNLQRDGVLNLPAFSGRKIKLSRNSSGYNERSIVEDISAEEYEKLVEEGRKIEEEVAKYASQKVEELEKSMGELKRGWIVVGRDRKLEDLNRKWQVFKDFGRGRHNVDEKNFKERGASDQEIEEMKNFSLRNHGNDELRNKLNDENKNFSEFFGKERFNIDFKAGKDILDGQEMTLEELPLRLKARLAELKIEKENLSESELAIIAERDRSIKEAKELKEGFSRIVRDNVGVVDKYSKRY